MEQTSLSKLVLGKRWETVDALKQDIYPIIEILMKDENAVTKSFKKHQKRAFVGRLKFFKEIFIRLRKQQIFLSKMYTFECSNFQYNVMWGNFDRDIQNTRAEKTLVGTWIQTLDPVLPTPYHLA